MSGRRAAAPVLGWAVLVTVLATTLWVWTDDPLPPTLFGSAAVAAWALGLFLLLRPARPPDVRALPDLSLSSVLVAVAIALMALGALIGVWLLLIGAGALALGMGGVGRELLAQRRAR